MTCNNLLPPRVVENELSWETYLRSGLRTVYGHIRRKCLVRFFSSSWRRNLTKQFFSFNYQKISIFSHNSIEGKNIHHCWIKFKRILRVKNDTCMFSLKFLGSLQRGDEVEGMALFRPSLFHVRLSTK